MRKIILNLVLASLATLIATSAEARVKAETLAGEFFEGRNISIRGKKLDTTVTLTTVDNQTFTLTGTTNKKATKLTIQLPLISADSKVRLTFTDKDGAVTVNTVIFNDPTLANGGVDIFANATVLPENVDTGIQGAPGAEGPEGPEGPPGPQGAPGATPTSLSGGSIIGPVTSANEVVFPTQNNITTLPNLVSAGKAGTTTNFVGPVAAPQGFTGNLTGDATNFTAALVGDITGTQSATVLSQAVLFGKTLPSHTAAAGVVATGNTLEVAIEKLDGNSNANAAAITAIQTLNTTQTTNIATNTTAIGTPTAANTANQIVKRDGSGNFAAGTITATSFVGPVTGLASNATTSVSFTGPLVGDVTGTQGATVIAPAVFFGKTVQAGFTPATGTVSVGDSLQLVLEKTTANITDTVNKTVTNAAAITSLDVTVSNLTTNVNNANAAQDTLITANTTAATAAQTTANTAVTNAATAQAAVDALSTVSNVTLTATSFSATNKSIVVLTSATFALENITDGTAGQKLTIVFADAATVNDLAGNINTEVNLIPTADDVLELIYTGTTWKQVSFSSN